MPRKNGPIDGERDAELTPEQNDLRRAAHKIAWFRMNGRNDTANPFTDDEPDRPAEVDRQDRR